MDKNKCVVSEVVFKSGNVPPIIGYFENGSLNFERESVHKCGIFRNLKEKEKYIVAVHTTDNALYVGHEPKDDLYRTLLAVQDKSNKVQLIEVDQVSLKAKSIVSSLPTTNVPSNYIDLYKRFGSKVLKRRTEQREKMTANVGGAEDQLLNVASNINVDNALAVLDDNEYRGIFIPCNQDSSNVNEVYNLNDIISPNELQELENETLALLSNSEEYNTQNYSAFLNTNFKKLPENNKFSFAQILLYAECLVQFLIHCSNNKSFGRKDVVCPFSEIINKKIMDNFTQQGKKYREVTPSLKDKTLCHAIVAGLMACKFLLDIEPLFGLVKISQEKMMRLCRVIGAIPLSRERKTTVVLKVPLPEISKLRKRKRL